jgi:hypothetical protein
VEQDNDQLKQQENQTLSEPEGLQDAHQTGEDIRAGARNEDQLDKIKQAAPEGGRDAYPELQAGATPSTGDKN